MSPARDAPTNLRSLETRINNLARELDRPVRRIQRALANTVVGQMLPAGVVKGGTAMKLRIGEGGSRFTPDLDAARAKHLPLDEYLDELADRLAAGWSGFTPWWPTRIGTRSTPRRLTASMYSRTSTMPSPG